MHCNLFVPNMLCMQGHRESTAFQTSLLCPGIPQPGPSIHFRCLNSFGDPSRRRLMSTSVKLTGHLTMIWLRASAPENLCAFVYVVRESHSVIQGVPPRCIYIYEYSKVPSMFDDKAKTGLEEVPHSALGQFIVIESTAQPGRQQLR